MTTMLNIWWQHHQKKAVLKTQRDEMLQPFQQQQNEIFFAKVLEELAVNPKLYEYVSTGDATQAQRDAADHIAAVNDRIRTELAKNDPQWQALDQQKSVVWQDYFEQKQILVNDTQTMFKKNFFGRKAVQLLRGYEQATSDIAGWQESCAKTGLDKSFVREMKPTV